MEIVLTGSEDMRTALAEEFDARFERLRRRLMAVCSAVVGADDAPDLVHETYLRAASRLHQLRDPALFDAWVVRIALNEAKTVLRSRRRFAYAPVTSHDGATESPDLSLRELVDRLPPRERAVIVLHYAYGYRMGEVARLLGLSAINVRTIALRARRRLRAQLEEAGS
jgi:RNA polymerase sigma factor (sigma-70 family)